MKFKLDENLDARLKDHFIRAGHDAHTVRDEALCSAPDDAIWAAAAREQRILVTQDRDFSNILVYPAGGAPGTVVLRGLNSSFAMRRILVETFLAQLALESPAGRLWIVAPGRIRIHSS